MYLLIVKIRRWENVGVKVYVSNGVKIEKFLKEKGYCEFGSWCIFVESVWWCSEVV